MVIFMLYGATADFTRERFGGTVTRVVQNEDFPIHGSRFQKPQHVFRRPAYYGNIPIIVDNYRPLQHFRVVFDPGGERSIIIQRWQIVGLGEISL